MGPFKLRMPASLRAELDASADRGGVSLNAELCRRLQRSIAWDEALGAPEMARLTFEMAASFAASTQGVDWLKDPTAYAGGVAAVLDTLLRRTPGPDKALAVEAVVNRLLTRLAQEREQVR
jgi:hypothetical protein